MKYSINTSARFDKEFKKLDRYTQLMIKSRITKNLVDTENPRIHEKALVGNKNGYWRYRIGYYRLICEIIDNELVILALSIGCRREVYKH